MSIHVTLFVVAAFVILIGPMVYFTWLGVGEETHQPGGAVGPESR